MGPSRHNTRAAAAAASAGSSSKRNDESASTSTSALASTAPPSRTPTRPSPYARTPTKPSSSSALTLGPSTPTSRTNSPMMLREIFSMISPFRGLSRARRSAAFGGADEADMDQEASNAAEDVQLGQPSKLGIVEEAVDTEDRMIEDAEEGLSVAPVSPPAQNAPSSQLSVLSDVHSATRSPSPRPRSSLAAPPTSLPLADSGLVTPGLRRQFAKAQSNATPSTPGPSTSYAPPPPNQTSPVSRNYDLLARFFSEKQRGGQGGLTEVEVEGCIRLIEESMATGRNLESEFARASNYGRHFAPAQTSGFAPSSRASSIAPPAMPSSQSMNTLFHPGTSRFNTSSSAYSFLAPRAPASQSGFGGSTSSSTRRRPIYLGPGMSGLSLSRRRPVVASASRAAAMAKTQTFGSIPRSSTDPNLARFAHDANETPDAPERAEEAKRRRTGVDAAAPPSSANGRGVTADQTVQFEPAYEKQARQSSLLAKDIAASSSNNSTSGSPLKRAAPSQDSAAAHAAAKTSPPKTTTRTASAIQDILKATPPVRPPVKPELVNPYQSTAPLPSKSKTAAETDSSKATPVRRSARTSMLTRAKARETARAAEKHSPPKESVLELIERTAPKTISKRKAANEVSVPQRTGLASLPEPASKPAAEQTSVEERKLQKTEEVQRRLEALNKAKGQQQQQQQLEQSSVPKPTLGDNKSTAKVSANLVPPQYTASKPKKPSPLSAAFQAPDSPSSDSEMASAPPSQPRGPAIAQPSFSFGSPARTTAPSSAFTFGAATPASTEAASGAPVSAPAAATAPPGGFSFSKPAAAAAVASTQAASSAAPASTPSFSFSPVATPPPAQQKPAAASNGFSFTAPSTTPASTSIAATSKQPSSVRDQVLAEDASELPRFHWQAPAVSAPSRDATQALRDEIQSVAQAALPKFDFIYEIETSSDSAQSAPVKTMTAPSAGFSFSAPTPASAPAASTASPTGDTAAEAESTDDPSKPSTSGLLGEGEGEETESTLLEVRSKIWRLDTSTKSWKDLGVCIAKIKHDSGTNKHRLLARNEANGKVVANFLLYKGLKSSLDKTVNAFLGFEGTQPTQYRMKVKTEESAGEFKRVLEEAANN